MAKTAAQRQADYRGRRATAGDNGERRINTWVSTGAALALARLAQHHGLSRRELLERLVLAADAHPLMARFHKPEDEKRSVVILPDEVWGDWLRAKSECAARAMLQECAPALLCAVADPK